MRSQLCVWALGAMLVLGTNTSTSEAQTTLYSNGSRNWSTGFANFSTVSGGPYNTVWTSGSHAVFEGAGGGTWNVADATINAASLTFTAGPFTFGNNTISLTGTGGSVNTNANSATINSILAGNVGVTKLGSGTLTLGNASNSYTGTTRISAGTLSVSAWGGLGGSGNAAGNLVINGGTLEYTGVGANTNRSFTIGANDATISANNTGTLSIANNGIAIGFEGSGSRILTLTGNTTEARIGGVIGDGTGGATSLLKNGTGTWRFSANNTYSGTTTVTQGTLIVGIFGASGSLGTGTIDLAGAGTLLRYRRTDDVTIANTITGLGTFDNFQGAGTVITLSGNNSYSGGTTFSNTGASTIRAGSATALGSSNGSLTMNASGQNSTLQLNNFNISVGDLSGNNLATITNNLAGNVSFSAGHTGDTTFAGIINNGSGTVALTKKGSGRLTLTNANTYSGATAITAGTLALSGSGSISSTAIQIEAGAQLDVTGLAAASYTLPVTGLTFGLPTTGAAGLLDASGKTLNLNNAAVVFSHGSLSELVYVLATYGTLNGTLATPPPTDYVYDYAYNGGTAVALIFVPEPSVVMFFATGLPAILWWTWRRKNAVVC